MDQATVAIYERRAREWAERRTPRHAAAARALGEAVRPGGVRLDVGCGPGWYTAELGAPAVALDAAGAMLDLVPASAPEALSVRADLESLPFRARCVAGGWARASYVHVARVRLPMALADLHRAMEPDGVAELWMFGGDYEGDELPGDDFEGRFFALWDRAHLEDVLHGAGFAVEDLETHTAAGGDTFRIRLRRDRTLPDTVGPGMRLLVCGLNPAIYAADAGVGFARPGNRFWPAALATGLVSRDRDARHALLAHGVGMTDVVKRATVAAAELTADEYRAGMARVERLLAWLRPGAVCFVGLTAWRTAVDRRAVAGVQDRTLGGVPVYLMPSTSGLNAHTKPAQFADHLRAAATLSDLGVKTRHE